MYLNFDSITGRTSLSIACNERVVVYKTVDIDGSIQMEFIITAGWSIYILHKKTKLKYQNWIVIV